MSTFTPDISPVTASSGQLLGLHSDEVRAWLGVPYAAPTSGQNRWRPPQPVASWQGVRLAHRFGDMAPQPQTQLVPPISGVAMSEDCLTLNIWAPTQQRTGGRLRPVMVWIHGGGYIIGSSAVPSYNGSALAHGGDVVVVSFNYRLGALGFLDFSIVNGTATGAVPFQPNLGLRDIVAALKWVRENIAEFGGNPDDVTVFGQSAGAACITTLMTMPAARGLFHKAIAQSPPATSVYRSERIQEVSSTFLSLLGQTKSNASDALNTMPAAQLVAPTMQLLNSVAINQPGTLAFAPVVDGELIPEHPIDVFLRGEQHAIPLLIGSTRDEAALFKMMKSPLMPTNSHAITRMFDELQREQGDFPLDLSELTRSYPDYPRQNGAIQISSDAGIRMPITWIAEAHSHLAPTYVYRFDQATPLLRMMGLGAVHASEIPYVFGTVPKKTPLNRRQAVWIGGLRQAHKVSERMQAHWIRFATTGQANWPAYETSRRETHIFNKNDALESDPSRTQRLAWGETVIGFR
jgi:para-nitrobenzyl esterase